MPGSRAHDLRVHVQHTGLVSNSTLHFCTRAKGGGGNRIRYPDEMPIERVLVKEDHMLSLRGNKRLCGWRPKPTSDSSARTQFSCAPRPGASALCSPNYPQPNSWTARSILQRGRWVGQLNVASDHGAIGSFGGCHERGKGAFAT